MEYIITFIEGLASFISPCILPLIPVYISCFATESKSTKKALINSIGFVLGFSMIFILLGIFASSFGVLIHRYSTYINIILGLLLIVIGLNYMDVISINFLNKTKGLNNNNKNLNFITAILFGILFSLTWSPCVGAFLSSALILASTTGSVVKGTILLALYSLGLAIPFIITTLFLEKAKKTFNFIKSHYNIINKCAGSFLIICGIWNIIKNFI